MKNEEWYWNERLNEELRQIHIYYEDIGYAAIRPAIIYKPKLSMDGNQWCALFGKDLQSGIAGFGKSPEKAMADFDREWRKEIEDEKS